MEGGPLATVLLILVAIVNEVASIGCFTCTSFNGNNTACEDPFNSTYVTARSQHDSHNPNYKAQCWAYKKGRDGLFPADHCIKIVGVGENNTRVTIRTCALDSGSLTADTEIVRISHCGHFRFEQAHYSGCVQSCDTDGCNSSSLSTFSLTLLISLLCTITRL
ncbi:hypothetical protein PFISCL1PPCAC_2527 [Pristionchus fissidentatus]|uniref:Protein sleepless n=1 Tax=Pristionchus fissidentatus TaxID=1538716 RepID=A0AAV5UYB8_9BILA|nr:hypothetical protein PFISCL1PPCAC_2527 [Pristionchus fissidentatus]